VGTPRAPTDLNSCPYVLVPTGTHGESPVLADKSSLTVHGNNSRSHHVTIRSFARRYSINVEALIRVASGHHIGATATVLNQEIRPRRAEADLRDGRPRTRGCVDADRVGHPVDLPEGYHAVPREQAWRTRPVTDSGCLPPGHRVVGLRQDRRMPHHDQRAKSSGDSWSA